jgi:hypothetical protein
MSASAAHVKGMRSAKSASNADPIGRKAGEIEGKSAASSLRRLKCHSASRCADLS